jgi:uncharacterized protein (PEP-CTERM system associated)
MVPVTTVTITQVTQKNKRENQKVRYFIKTVGLSLVSLGSYAGEFDFSPALTASFLNFESQTDSTLFAQGQVNAFLANPSLTLTYESPAISGSFLIDHNAIRQNREDEDSESDNFTEYRFTSNFNIIQNRLTAQASSSLTFRNTDPTQTLVNDFFLGGDSLTKVRNSNGGVFFRLPATNIVGIDWAGQFAKIESEETTTPNQAFNNQNIDNDNTSYNFRLYQGDRFQNIRWNFTSSFQDTNGSINQNDLRSRILDGEVSFGLFSKVRFIAVANDEVNQIENPQSPALSSQQLEFTSYGAGLEWFSANNRRIAITYNESDQGNPDSEDEEEESFLGIDVNWAFSPRTSIQGNLTRRFFGEAKSGSFNYNTRSFRITASYSESLTTFSRLLANGEDLGVFVCPVGQSQLSSCFQPDSLNFQLQPDQQFLSFFEQIPEISEEITLRKIGTLNFGYNRTNLTVSVALSAGQTEFLDTQREQDNNSVRLSANYQLGPKTTISANGNFTRTEFTDLNTNDDVRNHSVGIRRTINPKLSAGLDFRFTDRESDVVDRDLQDRRLTLSFDYSF